VAQKLPKKQSAGWGRVGWQPPNWPAPGHSNCVANWHLLSHSLIGHASTRVEGNTIVQLAGVL